ncbi:ribokinase [Tropicimonas sp. S265A]|uniref:ribokinase n=1 Tax=Tropicimonas sp. S265A TaxID=3415134 RepID=UPI003C7CF422
MGSTIVVMGIFVADAAFTAARLPDRGETVMGSGFALGPGGKGSNQAIAAARAGGEVHLITRIGADAFGDLAKVTWADAGVVAHAPVGAAPTGAAFIFLEEGTGQNAIIVAPGVASEISAADLRSATNMIADAAVFLTQLEAPMEAVVEGLRIARAQGVRTILNPAPAVALPRDELTLCDLVTPNETEAEGLTGQRVVDVSSAAEAARLLRAQGAGGAILTLGGQGAWVDAEGRAQHLPAREFGAVRDTTGAGDAFNGALAVALSEGASVAEAAAFANAAAAISVTRAGAGASMAARAEIDALHVVG